MANNRSVLAAIEDNSTMSQIPSSSFRKRFNTDELPGPSRKLPKCLERETSMKPGVVLHMVLKNFMCHSELVVDFVKNVNYIIGNNGSGKSAILTALVVGLGGKASLTNRGTSIKGFVKVGKNSGSIQITLKNGGPKAYRIDLYGETITVMRSFSQSGSSAYKIKSEQNEVISTQVKELHRITSALHIHVDNPICILNQDTSRNFLATTDTRLKFQLFMKGTGLEQLQETLKLISQNKKTASRRYEEKIKVLDEKREEYKQLERKLEQLQSIQAMKERHGAMEVELLWAQVQDVEGELQEKRNETQASQQNYDNMLDISQNRGAKLTEIQDRMNALEKEISDLKEEILVQNRPQTDCKNRIDSLTKTFAAKLREKQSVARDIATLRKDYDMCEANIKESTEKMSQKEQEKLARLRQVKEFEEKLQENQNRIHTAENELYQFDGDYQRKNEDLNVIRAELRTVTLDNEGIEDQLKNLRDNKGNELALYGGHIPNLHRILEQNAKRFKQAPIGPLGYYITAKDKKWSLSIEGHISGVVQAFLLDNTQDRDLFLQLFRQHFPRVPEPPIICGKFRFTVPNISIHAVTSAVDYISIYDAITVSSIPVLNVLLDQCMIESTLLIPTNDRAMELLSDARKVPRNCRLGLTIKGDKYYPDPNYKSYGGTYKHVRYLQVDPTELIRNLKQRLEEGNERKTEVSERYHTLDKAIKEHRKIMDDLRTKIERLKTYRRTVRRTLEEVNSTAEPENVNLQSLERELKQLEDELAQKTAQMENLEQELKTMKLNISSENDLLKELKSNSRGVEDRILPLQEEIEAQRNKQEDLTVSVTYDKKRLKDSKDKLMMSKQNEAEKEREFNVINMQANSLGVRPELIRKVIEIMPMLTKLERKIAVAESQSDNPIEIAENTKECKIVLDSLTAVMTMLKKDIRLLHELHDNRKSVSISNQDYFISLLKFSFEGVLKIRQFQGSLDIDMREKTLDMVVVPQQGSQGHTSTANLSGGERSFSTVAFLYSLWQCLNFPFYFLDEFDVFMDKVNRTAVMEILIEHAKSKPDVQFVFLTPQDVSFIKDDNVAIHKLDDPERRAFTQ